MAGTLTIGDVRRRIPPLLLWLGLGLVAVLSLAPLLFERLPADAVPPYASAVAAWGSKAAVVVVMLAAVAWRAAADRRDEPHAFALAGLFVTLAGLMTACHWYVIDRPPHLEAWQFGLYGDVLNHRLEDGVRYRIPHQFRPLPYGFVRSLEWLTGDWHFSCAAYRCFFTYWFVWGSYRFARLFLAARWALGTLVPLVLLYPLSIWHYAGQLTDPLSHALFVLAMVYAVEDRWLPLAAALGLGVLAKETVVLMVPAYWACYWRRPVAFLRACVLGAVCVAAFLGARLPLGWQPGAKNMNGTERLMIQDNLGIGEPMYNPAAPRSHNYLHPAVFVGTFLPFVAWHWRRTDRRLKALFLVLTPLLLLSNLCFGWMYESRNYMPLVPLLATMALGAPPPRDD
jgi:hypothetical protein